MKGRRPHTVMHRIIGSWPAVELTDSGDRRHLHRVASCDGVFTTLVPTTTVAPATTIDSGTGSVSDPLAITGASTLKFLQFAATLVGIGVLFMMLGRRRDRDGEPAQAELFWRPLPKTASALSDGGAATETRAPHSAARRRPRPR